MYSKRGRSLQKISERCIRSREFGTSNDCNTVKTLQYNLVTAELLENDKSFAKRSYSILVTYCLILLQTISRSIAEKWQVCLILLQTISRSIAEKWQVCLILLQTISRSIAEKWQVCLSKNQNKLTRTSSEPSQKI